MNVFKHLETEGFKLLFISVLFCGHGFAAEDTNGVKNTSTVFKRFIWTDLILSKINYYIPYCLLNNTQVHQM